MEHHFFRTPIETLGGERLSFGPGIHLYDKAMVRQIEFARPERGVGVWLRSREKGMSGAWFDETLV